MTIVPFGPWQPDLGQYATGANEARNCIRAVNGYRPLASMRDFNAGAITGLPTLLMTARANDGTMYVYGGDDTKLYRLNAATMAWDDVSKAGGYATGTQRWQPVQWGSQLVLANLNDPMQVANLGAGTPYADLSADAPTAKFLAAVGPYLLAGYTNDIVDGVVPQRLRWCGIEDITDWVPSAETTADWQDVPDVGHMTGLTGGRQANCLFEDGIVVGTLIGAPKAFRFDRIEGAQGCLEPNSVLGFKGRTYYLARSGFHMFDGRQSVPIGMRKVNRWFLGDAFFDKLPLMSVMIDLQQKVIAWLYCGSGGDGITPNRCMLYNYDEDEFTYATITAQLLGTFTTPGYNVDNIDALSPPGTGLEGLPAPLDDPFYTGGVPLAGAFVDKHLYTFTGNPMEATLETGYQRLAPGRRSILTEIREVLEGQGNFHCQVFTLDDQAQERTWPVTHRNAFGFCPARAEGAFHKVRLTVRDQWRAVFAADLTSHPLGSR